MQKWQLLSTTALNRHTYSYYSQCHHILKMIRVINNVNTVDIDFLKHERTQYGTVWYGMYSMYRSCGMYSMYCTVCTDRTACTACTDRTVYTVRTVCNTEYTIYLQTLSKPFLCCNNASFFAKIMACFI